MTPAQKLEATRRCLDPVVYQQAYLGRRLWEKQRRIAIAAATKRATVVKGCHASGKTYALSGAVLHHLQNHQHGKVLTIAPTLRQVKLFWDEVELARARCAIPFPEQCTATGLQLSEDRYGLGFSSSKGVNAQGFHGEDVLIITDESPGIISEVWDAIEGIRAGGRVRICKLGNPTVPSGPFYDDFTRGRAMTECISISAFDTPNLQNLKTGLPYTIEELDAMGGDELEYAVNPFLVTRHWVLEKYKRWGPNNPRYVSRVLGEFPSQSERSLLDLEWVERARREPTERELSRAREMHSQIQVGVDVAGEGSDETAVCARVNGIFLDRKAWPDKDPRGAVVAWIAGLRNRFPHFPLGYIVVDTVGIGYNFALHLADHFQGVMGFKAGAAPMDPEQYVDAKAEQNFRMREMYKEGYLCHLPEAVDEETEAQLCSIEYEEMPNGKIRIEPKKAAAKRGIDSPDRAEAQMLACCMVVHRERLVLQPLEMISDV